MTVWDANSTDYLMLRGFVFGYFFFGWLNYKMSPLVLDGPKWTVRPFIDYKSTLFSRYPVQTVQRHLYSYTAERVRQRYFSHELRFSRSLFTALAWSFIYSFIMVYLTKTFEESATIHHLGLRADNVMVNTLF